MKHIFIYKHDTWNRCEVCGQFISDSDFSAGKASNIMILPESLTTVETFETLCSKHKT